MDLGKQDNPKTSTVSEAARIDIEVSGTPAIPRNVSPATATDQSYVTIFPSFPSTSVGRRSVIIAMPNILTPFPDIPRAYHINQRHWEENFPHLLFVLFYFHS